MYIQSLLLSVKGLSPEGKYLLVQMIKCFDIDNPLEVSAVRLAKICGVSRKIVVPTMIALSDAGLVSIIRQGKVKKAYQFSDDLVKALIATKKYRQPLSYSKVMIDEVLDSNNDNHKALNVSHKLLLCLFLAHADKFGIVHNFSVSDISKFTGMKRERIRSQIKKLINLGYIIYRVPGVNHDYMFGKAKGAFFLDVNNKFITTMSPVIKEESLRLINDDNFYDVGKLVDDLFLFKSSRKVRYVGHHVHHEVYDPMWFEVLMKILAIKSSDINFIVYFQYRLEQYICHMLSKYSHREVLFIEEREKRKIRKLMTVFLTKEFYNRTDIFDDQDINVISDCFSSLVSSLYLGLKEIENGECEHNSHSYQIRNYFSGKRVLVRRANG
ncbi:helix-turn-helix domain-containing protein [Photobacterium sp. SDRW27]|uniref:helix-turn-helix domain-containing protein n=1 Tax=Photobacterium obscurum TaxID=2829490 RepID=UPI002244451D|nr:helix-turn-helix domain-containing protein [Photobacterium obscurum]MCW8331949.1 helix-turn-helix domain-containing protein [Photobacterium obscurum]